jgi:hypothetical protein
MALKYQICDIRYIEGRDKANKKFWEKLIASFSLCVTVSAPILPRYVRKMLKKTTPPPSKREQGTEVHCSSQSERLKWKARFSSRRRAKPIFKTSMSRRKREFSVVTVFSTRSVSMATGFSRPLTEMSTRRFLEVESGRRVRLTT